MCSNVERFINVIYMTKYMNELWFNNFNEYLKCIELTQDWEKFNNIEDIINLNNEHLNNAIQEIKKDKKLLELVQNNTN